MYAMGIVLVIANPLHEPVVARQAPEVKRVDERQFVEWFDANMLTIMRVPCALFPVFTDRNLEFVRLDMLGVLADAATKKGAWREAFAAHLLAAKRLSNIIRKLPADREARFRAATNARGFAKVSFRVGEAKSAEQTRKYGLDLVVKLLADEPKHLAAKILFAFLLTDSGDELLYFPDKSERAIEDFKKAIDVWMKIIEDDPANDAHRIELAYAWNGLGGAHFVARTFKEANEAYAYAKTLRELLVTLTPKDANRWVELAGSTCNLGNVIVEMRGKYEEAIPFFDKGIAMLEKALMLDPNVPNAKEYLGNCHWGKFLVAVRLKRFAEADASANRAFEHWSVDARRKSEIAREQEFAEAGQHERAAKNLAEIGKRKDLTTENHYYIALAYSAALEAAKANDDLATVYAQQAVEYLRAFHKSSKYPAALMLEMTNGDKALDPLRKRDPFQAWVKELNAAASKEDDKKPR